MKIYIIILKKKYKASKSIVKHKIKETIKKKVLCLFGY